MEYDLSKYNNPLILLYGGTFSPFTMYNLKIANDISKEVYHKNKGLRDIIFYFIPTSDKYNSHNVLSKYIGGNSNKNRINMLQIVCDYLNNKNKGIYFKVSTNEIKENKTVSTYNSVIQIQKNIIKNNTIIVNNDLKIILIERHVKEILKGLWKNPLSLLSKNIITIPSQHKHLTINMFEKEIDMHKMILNDKNIKNKEYLKLLSSNKKYLLSKLEIYNDITQNILQFTPTNTYDKLQNYYNKTIHNSEINKYFIPELLQYIIKNNLYNSSTNKTIKYNKKNNKTIKRIKILSL
jgi:hypothetical protein